MINELAEKIWNQAQFKKDYRDLICMSLKKSLSLNNTRELEPEAVSKLLQSATTFAATTEAQFNEAAYRIGIAASSLYGAEFKNIDTITDFILRRMGNFPTSNLLSANRNTQHNGNLPAGLWFEATAHEIDNTIQLDGRGSIILTDFQLDLWECLEATLSVSVTAPTSAGKSYALQRFLVAQCIKRSKYCAVYLVPTRALINQVSDSLTMLLKNWEAQNTVISSIPVPPSELNSARVLYVLTQERLHILNEAQKDLPFDLVIVDESQFIAEGSRGIVLQTVIEKAIGRKDLPIMFAAPLAENPDIFPKYFELKSPNVIDESRCPVAQNLIFLDVDPIKPNEIDVSVFFDEESSYLGKKNISAELYDPKSTLALLAWEFGREDKNLVYAGGPALCEDIASLIANKCLQTQEHTTDKDVNELANFVRDTIHPRYVLATTLDSGVSFHYGNMPAIIRRSIEDFFNEGKISYLVCTSTLLQGINLPAKNLFMLNPTIGRVRGKDIPITSVDFWNLAGRAGRLGKDYEGNVFLINFRSWIDNPLKGNKRQSVYPALSKQLSENTDEVVHFIKDKTHSSGIQGEEGLECTFVKLFNDYKQGKLISTFRKVRNLPEIKQKEISDALKEVEKDINIPQDILEKNITISPYRQQSMLSFLESSITDYGAQGSIPLHPLSNRAYDSLSEIFHRIHRYFEQRPNSYRAHTYFALLALRWMRGEAYREIIDDAYRIRRRRSKRQPNINTVIRNVMKDIEEKLRFKYLNYTSCYIDLLKEALTRTNNEAMIERIPQIPLFLELGASSMTMVNLIGIGLSRTTARILTSRTPDKNMDRAQVLYWLHQLRLDTIDLPLVCLRELEKYL